MTTSKKKVGRPSTYSKELADHICEQLACGLSMRTVCAADDMPAMSSVFKWLREHKEFSEQYAHAKHEAADAMAEEILSIADEAPNLILGIDRSDGARVQAERMKIDTRKWIMAKMKPKVYGDKLDVTSDGKRIETAPVVISDIKPRGQDASTKPAKAKT